MQREGERGIFKYSNCRTYLQNVTKTKGQEGVENKSTSSVYIQLARYYEYVTETMCGGTKNAKTIMRNIFRYGHLSRTAAGQTDRTLHTLSHRAPLPPNHSRQLPNKMGQQFVWLFALWQINCII